MKEKNTSNGKTTKENNSKTGNAKSTITHATVQSIATQITAVPCGNRSNALDVDSQETSQTTDTHDTTPGTDVSAESNETTYKKPIHFPASVCNPISPSKGRLSDKFLGYRKQARRRVSRFYIYGINSRTASESAMRDFLEEANVHATFLRYFEVISLKRDRKDIKLKKSE